MVRIARASSRKTRFFTKGKLNLTQNNTPWPEKSSSSISLIVNWILGVYCGFTSSIIASMIFETNQLFSENDTFSKVYIFHVLLYISGGFSDLENLNIYYMGFYRVKALFSQTYKWDLIC